MEIVTKKIILPRCDNCGMTRDHMAAFKSDMYAEVYWVRICLSCLEVAVEALKGKS